MMNEAPNQPPASDGSEVRRRSERWIAGGVVSMNRKTHPALVFVRARGCRLEDTEGRQYIDFHGAFAPHLLGHNPPEVVEAVKAVLDRGESLMGSGTTPWEAALAEELCRVVPGMECIQLLNTGSEATLLAIRLARAWTGREGVLTTLGGYNGWHDEVGRAVMPSLEQLGPRRYGEGYEVPPISAGIPVSTRERLRVVNFNDLESVEAVLRTGRIACLITEPVLQNVGVILPVPGYLEGLRELCSRYGTLLIFDEVKTGFRTALGGYQSVCGILPDLSVFGKAVASGYPLAVLGGKREVMDLFGAADLSRRVLVAGTYNGHPVNVAAARATLAVLQREDGKLYGELESRASRLQAGMEKLLGEAGVTAVVSRNASAFCVYFMDHLPRDWHDVLEHHDMDFDRRYREGLIAEGIYHFPLPCKQGSVSAAHGDPEIEETLAATERVLNGIRR